MSGGAYLGDLNGVGRFGIVADFDGLPGASLVGGRDTVSATTKDDVLIGRKEDDSVSGA